MIQIDLTQEAVEGNCDELLVTPSGSQGRVQEDEESDGWANYQICNVLGEGSYGKVYKVI